MARRRYGRGAVFPKRTRIKRVTRSQRAAIVRKKIKAGGYRFYSTRLGGWFYS